VFASEAFLGVRASKRVTYCCIASPAGPYFASGVKPVSIWISTTYTRAAPGGTGAAKCGGNYASSLVAQQEAATHGCDQVMFVDAAEHAWVEELGGMNVYLVTRDRRRSSAGSAWRSCSTAWLPATSPRSSPAAPPP
jgi:branched-chain amino acid aminotransferase